jgi:pyruvate dehydrogenase E2 component (dihydrolipoamide acetyltransferase)
MPPTPPTLPTVPPPAVETPREDRSASMQRRIAVTMERSNREIPHYYVTYDCDVGTARGWLDQHNATVPPAERVVLASVLLAATARAAAAVPRFNGSWVDGSYQSADAVNVAFIVSQREGGLLAPVIAGADTLDVTEIMRRMHDLVTRARSGHLRASDLEAPTITVSNLGDQGADSVLGVIYPPQVALVGFGRMLDRPWARDGLLGVRPVVTISLAADHRASDGHRASRFLAHLDAVLQSPESLERTPT